jgi:hypothetical protein
MRSLWTELSGGNSTSEGAILVDVWTLSRSSGLVVGVLFFSSMMGLGQSWSILVASVRAVLQLSILSVVLVPIFPCPCSPCRGPLPLARRDSGAFPQSLPPPPPPSLLSFTVLATNGDPPPSLLPFALSSPFSLPAPAVPLCAALPARPSSLAATPGLQPQPMPSCRPPLAACSCPQLPASCCLLLSAAARLSLPAPVSRCQPHAPASLVSLSICHSLPSPPSSPSQPAPLCLPAHPLKSLLQ